MLITNSWGWWTTILKTWKFMVFQWRTWLDLEHSRSTKTQNDKSVIGERCPIHGLQRGYRSLGSYTGACLSFLQHPERERETPWPLPGCFCSCFQWFCWPCVLLRALMMVRWVNGDQLRMRLRLMKKSDVEFNFLRN